MKCPSQECRLAEHECSDLPFMHRALGTFSLTGMDWAIVLTAAFTICPVLELAKWMERRGWLGRLS